MPLYRVHAYDDEHYATLVIRTEAPERAGSIARQFVAMMHLGYYPANHGREFPEVVRVEQLMEGGTLRNHKPVRDADEKAATWRLGGVLPRGIPGPFQALL